MKQYLATAGLLLAILCLSGCGGRGEAPPSTIPLPSPSAASPSPGEPPKEDSAEPGGESSGSGAESDKEQKAGQESGETKDGENKPKAEEESSGAGSGGDKQSAEAPKAYEFTEYGAKMTLPDAWKEDVIIQKLDNNKSKPPYRAAYGALFAPPEKKAEGKQYVAVVKVYEETAWQDLADADKVKETELATVGGYVYCYVPAQTNPFDDDSEEGEAFEDMALPATKAKETIKIEKM